MTSSIKSSGESEELNEVQRELEELKQVQEKTEEERKAARDSTAWYKGLFWGSLCLNLLLLFWLMVLPDRSI